MQTSTDCRIGFFPASDYCLRWDINTETGIPRGFKYVVLKIEGSTTETAQEIYALLATGPIRYHDKILPKVLSLWGRLQQDSFLVSLEPKIVHVDDTAFIVDPPIMRKMESLSRDDIIGGGWVKIVRPRDAKERMGVLTLDSDSETFGPEREDIRDALRIRLIELLNQGGFDLT